MVPLEPKSSASANSAISAKQKSLYFYSERESGAEHIAESAWKNEITPIFTKNNDNTGLFALSRKLSAEVFKHKKIWYNNFVYSGVVEHIGSTSDRSAPRPFPGDDRDGGHAVRGKWTGFPGI